MSGVFLGNVFVKANIISSRFVPHCQRMTIKGIGNLREINPETWTGIRTELTAWASRLKIEEIGSRLVLDFSGSARHLLSPQVDVYFLGGSALPSAFRSDWGEPGADYPLLPQYPLTWQDFQTHDKGNVLFHIANQRTDKFPFVERIVHHPTSTADFAVITDGSPKAASHSLIIAKGRHTCLSLLPGDLWSGLREVIASEITDIEVFVLEMAGYRIIMNNGPQAQTIAQMHAHLIADRFLWLNQTKGSLPANHIYSRQIALAAVAVSSIKQTKWLGQTSPWFAFGNPILRLYLESLKIDLRGKRVLDVLADGDLGLLSLAQDVGHYQAFDVSLYAKAFFQLKMATLRELSREGFIEFFIPKQVRLEHSLDHDYVYPPALPQPRRGSKQYSWGTYFSRLRPLLDIETRDILDPLIFNSYREKNGQLEAYARLMTVEEITREKIKIIPYLIDDDLYKNIQHRLLFGQPAIQVEVDEARKVFNRLIDQGVKLDVLSLSNIPTYCRDEQARLEIFSKASALLGQEGQLVFHVNDPGGWIRADQQPAWTGANSREGVYLALRQDAENYGFSLVHYPASEVEVLINKLYGRNWGYSWSIFAYTKNR